MKQECCNTWTDHLQQKPEKHPSPFWYPPYVLDYSPVTIKAWTLALLASDIRTCSPAHLKNNKVGESTEKHSHSYGWHDF